MNHKGIIIRTTFAAVAIAVMFLSGGCGTLGSQRQLSAPELKILYSNEEEQTEKIPVAQFLQAQLTNAGIPVTLEPVSTATYYERVRAGKFQCALALWYLDPVDPQGFLTDSYSKSGFRLSNYESYDFDQAYLSGMLAPTARKQMDGFFAAQKILMNDLPWVPLYSNSEHFLLAPGAEEFRSNAYQDYDYRWIKGESIRVSSNVEPQTMDPALIHDLAGKHVAMQSYEGLVTMDDKLQIVPALAESWKFSPDMDRLTFNLRKGIQFHGGHGTFTSEDVRASFERMLRRNSPYSYIFDHVKGIDEFKSKAAAHVSGFIVESADRFTIELKEPFPAMLNWLLAPAAFVLPAGLQAPFDFSKGSVGTGPFILTSWDGELAILKANPAYWGRGKDGAALPRSKSLSIRIMKESKSSLTAFQHGELDVLNVPTSMYGEVFDQTGKVQERYSKYKLKVVPLYNLKFLAFRMGVGLWGTDATLRKKVYDGIDRNSIVLNLFRGRARVARDISPQMETTLP